MKDASEDEQEADFATGSQRTDSESMTHPKAQREEELRRMMDEEGKRRPAYIAFCLYDIDVPILEREKSHAENGDAEQLPDAEVAPASDATEACAMVPKGRRRGRRRIMKKKTIKDEEGYLGWPRKFSFIFILCGLFY